MIYSSEREQSGLRCCPSRQLGWTCFCQDFAGLEVGNISSVDGSSRRVGVLTGICMRVASRIDFVARCDA